MQSGPRDVAQIRLDNALALFDEFVQQTIKHPDPATLRGLERRFAERLQIQPSYWSQIKGRSRQIGERLARQFEQLCHKPPGWMDLPHDGSAAAPSGSSAAPAAAARGAAEPPSHQAQDDDERFIVSLVLSYYRRHPQRARVRLLDLLGEVLTPPAETAAPLPAPLPVTATGPAPATRGHGRLPAGATPPPREDPDALWARMQAGVAPLKRKR